MSIAELAIAEHYRSGLLPGGLGDAALMRRYMEAMQGAPSLETPMRELGAWIKQRGKV